MNVSLRTLALAGALATLAGPALSAQESRMSFGLRGIGGLNFGGGSASAFMPVVDYERTFGLMALTVGAGYLSYTYTEEEDIWNYEEKGKGPGIFADLKFYPGRTWDGFYVGPGVSVFSAKVDWTEADTGYHLAGDSSGAGVEVHARVGWVFSFGTMTLDPNLQVGYFLSMPKSNTKDTSLGVYALVGVNLGFRF